MTQLYFVFGCMNARSYKWMSFWHFMWQFRFKSEETTTVLDIDQKTELLATTNSGGICTLVKRTKHVCCVDPVFCRRQEWPIKAFHITFSTWKDRDHVHEGGGGRCNVKTRVPTCVRVRYNKGVRRWYQCLAGARVAGWPTREAFVTGAEETLSGVLP